MNCPVCETDLVHFRGLPNELREQLESDPKRQHQSAPHRQTKHSVCPECTMESHGCGQPYVLPEKAMSGR